MGHCGIHCSSWLRGLPAGVHQLHPSLRAHSTDRGAADRTAFLAIRTALVSLDPPRTHPTPRSPPKAERTILETSSVRERANASVGNIWMLLAGSCSAAVETHHASTDPGKVLARRSQPYITGRVGKDLRGVGNRRVNVLWLEPIGAGSPRLPERR